MTYPIDHPSYALTREGDGSWGDYSYCQVFYPQETRQSCRGILCNDGSNFCGYLQVFVPENSPFININSFLAVVMSTNCYAGSTMHTKVCLAWIWSLTLSVEKNHPLTSQLPDRKRKIHEHPQGLGEVHLFPDITKWDTGRCCCSLSFGGESKWRLVSGE